MEAKVVDLSIIIVNWNVRDLLRECLRSIEAYHGTLKVETIVVDSASSDGSVEMIRREFPHVRLLAQAENVGFVRGNNIGLAAAQGRYLFLLNPDTQLHPHALTTLVTALERHPAVGIVGPHTLNPDGTHQSTRRRFPSLWVGLLDGTWFGEVLPARLLDGFHLRHLPGDGTYEVDWVQGSALLARRAVYEQIGGLDTAYSMFFEEVDWCRRAKQAGWKVLYVGDAYLTHHGGSSTAQVATRAHLHFQHSKLRYFRKFHGRWAALLVRLALIASYGIRVLLDGAKLMLGHKPDVRRDHIRTYGVVLRSLLGAGEKRQP